MGQFSLNLKLELLSNSQFLKSCAHAQRRGRKPGFCCTTAKEREAHKERVQAGAISYNPSTLRRERCFIPDALALDESCNQDAEFVKQVHRRTHQCHR